VCGAEGRPLGRGREISSTHIEGAAHFQTFLTGLIQQFANTVWDFQML